MLISIFILLGCDKQVENGKKSIINLVPEPNGSNCSNGGYKILTGLDANGNNLLEEDEVQNEEFLCNGVSGNSGVNSLVQVLPEEGYENCPNGGYIVNSGMDSNGDNILSEDEIQSSVFICNGLNGESDVQIRLPMVTIQGTSNWGNAGSTGGFFIGKLENFNKNYYPGVDSIVFVTNIETGSTVSEASAELYDLTNHSVIINSTVTIRNTFRTHLISGNFFDNLPNEEIDLVIQLRSEYSQHPTWVSGNSFILLYRTK